MTKSHFISGLPRSGSTLLAGILKQNPRFHAAMTGPVLHLINGALEQMGANGEFYSFFDSEKRKRICRAIYEAYYHGVTDRSIVFDTNRLWTARMHQLAQLFDDFKVVCTVRNPAWVMDSFERIYRKNPFEYSQMFSAQSRQTVYSRCEALASGVGAFGSAWTALKEAYYGEHSKRLLLVDYDLLVERPEQALQLIYQFVDEPWFAHDFDNVDYSENEFDYKIGVQGLHEVQRKVSFQPRRTILPPELFRLYSDMAFWNDSSATEASIIKAKAVTSASG